MSEAGGEVVVAQADPKAARTAAPLVPQRFRWVLIVEVLLVLIPLLYIYAGWRANG